VPHWMADPNAGQRFNGNGLTGVNVVQIAVGTLPYVCKPISIGTKPNLCNSGQRGNYEMEHRSSL
jgi:hypothetical protein